MEPVKNLVELFERSRVTFAERPYATMAVA